MPRSAASFEGKRGVRTDRARTHLLLIDSNSLNGDAMKRMLAMVGLAAALTVSFDASAAPSAELRQRINVMLGAPEYAPSAKEWTALGPDAAEVLREIALNRKILVLKRGRAATALGFFKTESTRLALSQLVGEQRGAWLLRGKAARALAHAYGAEALPVIQPLLASQHKRVREVAILAIATVPVLQSRSILVKRLPLEKNAHVRAVLTRAVEHIDKQRARR